VNKNEGNFSPFRGEGSGRFMTRNGRNGAISLGKIRWKCKINFSALCAFKEKYFIAEAVDENYSDI